MSIRSALNSMDRSNPKYRWPWDGERMQPESRRYSQSLASRLALRAAEVRVAILRDKELSGAATEPRTSEHHTPDSPSRPPSGDTVRSSEPMRDPTAAGSS